MASNLYQKTVDYPNEWANGCHVMLDSDGLVTVRWDQVVFLGMTSGWLKMYQFSSATPGPTLPF